MKDNEGYEGVWRTIRGAKVFIRKGEDLNSAMKRKKYYHTSNHNFEKFDNDMPRKAILGGQYGYGHYFFDDKNISDGYGAYSKYQYEAEIKVNNWFEAKENDFNEKIKKMGYNYKKDDIAKFLQKNGYGGSIIEHKNAMNKNWYEYVVYDSKDIKIINKKEM